MLYLNLKVAWRNLWKNKSHTLINMLSLSIGLAGCMLIFIFISYQLGFDNQYPNKNRIYRFVTAWKYPGYDDFSKGVPVPMTLAVKEELASIEKTGVIIKRNGIIHIKDSSGKETVKERSGFFYAEPGFFEILPREWLKGSPEQSLSAPGQLTLSQSTAERYFGSTENAIGKSITIGSAQPMTVTGIFKDSPANSSFPLKIVASYSSFNSKKYINWDGVNSAMEFYVLLKNGQTPATMQNSLDAFNQKHYQQAKIPGNQRNLLQPLSEIHFDPRYGSFSENSISMSEIYGLIVIGLFLILTACINFINLSTAQTASRSKEVGIRKVLGGLRKQLFIQFLAETMTVTLISLIIACILTELALPYMSRLFEITLTGNLLTSPAFIGFMILLALSVGLLAGFYPAIVISGFSPVQAIRTRLIVNTGGLALRKVLVVLQFSITVVLLIATMVVSEQMQYMRDKPLGFDSQAVAMINLPGDSLSQTRYDHFKEMALRLPGVRMISYCQTPPSSDNITTSDFSYRGIHNSDFEVRSAKADADYFRLFDLKFIAGKPFSGHTDYTQAVVNQTFLKRMGIQDPGSAIGQIINPNGKDLLITGVVKDYNDLSLREKISPLVIYSQKGEYYSIAVKMDAKAIPVSMHQIEKLWNNTFPENLYESSFLREDLNSYYQSERLMGILFKTAAGLIVFISLLGLLGLISFVATQRSKEMAIRKILGATTLELISLLNASFIKMVLIANLLGWPLAYLFISRWLSSYEYRIAESIWPFLIAGFISILITLITVSFRSYRTATRNVMEVIKYE